MKDLAPYNPPRYPPLYTRPTLTIGLLWPLLRGLYLRLWGLARPGPSRIKSYTACEPGLSGVYAALWVRLGWLHLPITRGTRPGPILIKSYTAFGRNLSGCVVGPSRAWPAYVGLRRVGSGPAPEAIKSYTAFGRNLSGYIAGPSRAWPAYVGLRRVGLGPAPTAIKTYTTGFGRSRLGLGRLYASRAVGYPLHGWTL